MFPKKRFLIKRARKGDFGLRAGKIIFDIANVLNTTILPSNVRFLILHKFRTPCIFEIML